MRDALRPNGDQKDIMIGGCHVRLTYDQAADSRWIVNAAIRCGVGENAEEQSVASEAFETRDAAERDALQQVTSLLGENTDRSRSRVRNWS